MPELYDERRQEPRYPTAGVASFTAAGRQFDAEILDVSLNGLKLTRPADFDLARSERFRITLTIPGIDPFEAEVMLVHTEGAQLGVEFYDMPPRDFGVLAGVIEHFQRLRRRATA